MLLWRLAAMYALYQPLPVTGYHTGPLVCWLRRASASAGRDINGPLVFSSLRGTLYSYTFMHDGARPPSSFLCRSLHPGLVEMVAVPEFTAHGIQYLVCAFDPRATVRPGSQCVESQSLKRVEVRHVLIERRRQGREG